MSRILRRPMFRGGGPVNSYGTGIAAPLVPGYRMGGNVRGGIVDLPGGYDQTANERFKLFNAANLTMPNTNVSPGLTYLENLKNIKQGNIPMIPINNTSVAGVTDKKEGEKEVLTSEKIIDSTPKEKDTGWTGVGESEVGITDEFGEGLTILTPEEEYEKQIDIILNKIERGKRLSPKEEKIRIEENIKDYNEVTNLGETQLTKNEILSNYDNEGNKLPPSLRNQNELITSPENQNKETEESLELSAKDAIAENQKLFAELLGADKARGQDISDMLLRFSGSGGNTIGEKFQNYVRAESAAGPSRSEKIKQTAAGLAINDYVAGKRSDEQIKKLKEVETFKVNTALDKVNINKNDTFRSALNKKAVALKSGTTTSSKVIGETIRDILDVNNTKKDVWAPTKTFKDLDDVNKKIDDLNMGINIITLKDGRIIIKEKISDTELIDTPFKI